MEATASTEDGKDDKSEVISQCLLADGIVRVLKGRPHRIHKNFTHCVKKIACTHLIESMQYALHQVFFNE